MFLSQLESTKDKDYIQIVVWCLGNLCGDEKCRNILLVESSRLDRSCHSEQSAFVSSFSRIVPSQPGHYGELHLLSAKCALHDELLPRFPQAGVPDNHWSVQAYPGGEAAGNSHGHSLRDSPVLPEHHRQQRLDLRCLSHSPSRIGHAGADPGEHGA